MDKRLLVIDKEYCPDNDAIIMQDMCGECEYYCGFELYYGQRCVWCSCDSENDED